MADTFTTPKGTILYLQSIQGKPYLPAAERMIWFREEHPEWAIRTEVLASGDEALVKASILREDSFCVAQAHKAQSRQDFPLGHIEKAETAAVGRALAMCGYGTQFTALEFAEGDKLADAPAAPERAEPKRDPSEIKPAMPPGVQNMQADMHNSLTDDPGQYKIKVGRKYQGMMIKDLKDLELKSYISWIKDDNKKKNQAVRGDWLEFIQYAEAFLMKQAKPLPPAESEPPWPTDESEQMPF